MKKPGGGMILAVRNSQNPAAGGLDNLFADDLIQLPIGPFGQQVGTNRLNEFKRRIFREEDDIIHRLQRGNHPSPLSRRHHRPARPFEPPHRGVAVDRDDQAIGLFFDSFKGIQMADVQEVETTVGEGDDFTLALQPPNDRQQPI